MNKTEAPQCGKHVQKSQQLLVHSEAGFKGGHSCSHIVLVTKLWHSRYIILYILYILVENVLNCLDSFAGRHVGSKYLSSPPPLLKPFCGGLFTTRAWCNSISLSLIISPSFLMAHINTRPRLGPLHFRGMGVFLPPLGCFCSNFILFINIYGHIQTANKVNVGERKLDNFPLIFIFGALLSDGPLSGAKKFYPPFGSL